MTSIEADLEGNHELCASPQVMEQHICRVRIWHPEEALQLFEIGPEDVAQLILIIDFDFCSQ